MAFKLKKDTVKFEKVGDKEFSLNALGYVCPHVQIFTEKALKKITTGDELTVVFDNPSSGESISYLCTANGDDIFEKNESAGTFTWKIRRA